MFVFLNNFYFKGNSAIYWFNISMKLYVMHRLLGNGGFDLFFLLQVSVFGYECVFSFYSEKVGKPNTNQWLAYPTSFIPEGGLSYCHAVYNSLYPICTEVQ